MGTMLQLTAGDGFELSAYRADPAAAARGAVVVVQEIFGVNSHIRSVCDGFSADGYVAIAPALFDRIRPGVELGYAPEDIATGRELKGASPNDKALRAWPAGWLRAHTSSTSCRSAPRRARGELAAMHVLRGEATPAPLVLQLVKPVLV